MANNLTSNVTDKIKRRFAPMFESSRVLTKMVNTSEVQGDINPSSGERVRLKRPHDYTALRTSGGDITGQNKNDIVSGTFEAEVQPMITVPIPWTIREEAIQLDQLDEILKPAVQRCVTELETSLGEFMIRNSGLRVGSVGSQVNDWADVAGAGSLLKEIGAPSVEKYYVGNSFMEQNLSGVTQGINNLPEGQVAQAFNENTISSNFAGMRIMSSNALDNYQVGATTDRQGVIGTAPDATYTTAKDTMQQTIQLTGLAANITEAVRPGDQITITQAGRSRINVSTRRIIFGADGSEIPWTYTVVTGGNTDGSGNVTVTVTNAAINHTTGDGAGQYTNISNPIASGDSFTIEGTANSFVKPNLFFHKSAFVLGTVPLPQLNSTSTFFRTQDGITVRVSQGSNFEANTQEIRFDLFPVFGVSNPLFAGHGYG